MLYDQPDGDPCEGVPDKVSGVHFGDVEPDDRNLTPAQAQLNNLLQPGNRMHRSVEHIDSCSRWTVYVQLDSQDRVTISIDLRELVEAGPVHDGLSVIGCNCAHIVVEARAGWAKHSSPRLHYGTFPQQGERKMSKCQRDGRASQLDVGLDQHPDRRVGSARPTGHILWVTRHRRVAVQCAATCCLRGHPFRSSGSCTVDASVERSGEW